MKKPLSPPAVRPRSASEDELDQLCADALAYLAEEPSRLERFFDLTGLSVTTLRQAAATDGFVAQIVDYLTSDGDRLHAFAAAKDYEVTTIEAIRLGLLQRDAEA